MMYGADEASGICKKTGVRAPERWVEDGGEEVLQSKWSTTGEEGDPSSVDPQGCLIGPRSNHRSCEGTNEWWFDSQLPRHFATNEFQERTTEGCIAFQAGRWRQRSALAHGYFGGGGTGLV
jgi:hypothetical protein